MIRYRDFWSGFDPKKHLLHSIFSEIGHDVEVIGPFRSAGAIKRLLKHCILAVGIQKKADFFITGENCPPRFHAARKQIGFWRSYSGRDDVFRFPYWMWHLDWPELKEVPEYPRYGMPLSINRLMRPICEYYNQEQLLSRLNCAVLFTMHLREPRRRLFNLTLSTLGCDGFGGAFGTDNRCRPKMPTMEGYRYSLCPENSIGDGYITEKIPEAFHSGCIPITWCRPDDLQEDFNPNAVINLYGLDDVQVTDILTEISGGGRLYRKLLSEPLLQKRPSLTPLTNFILDKPILSAANSG
jgi:hypothetical protein